MTKDDSGDGPQISMFGAGALAQVLWTRAKTADASGTAGGGGCAARITNIRAEMARKGDRVYRCGHGPGRVKSTRNVKNKDHDKDYEKTGTHAPLMRVYHSGRFKIKSIDKSRLGARDAGWYGTGFYVSMRPDSVYGPTVTAFDISPTAKVLWASVDARRAAPGLLAEVVAADLRLLRARGAAGTADSVRTSLLRNAVEWVHAVDRFATQQRVDIVVFSDEEIVVKNTRVLSVVKRADHVEDRRAERVPSLPAEHVQALRAWARGQGHLEGGDYHVPLHAADGHVRGHAALRVINGRLTVTTILAPYMRPRGPALAGPAHIHEHHKAAAIKLARAATDSSACIEGHDARLEARLKTHILGLQAKLRPGDIINTNPRALTFGGKILKAVSRATQGTRYGHSALYDGKGHVIEARGMTVIRRPLMDLARCNQIVAVTPKTVSSADRRHAVAWMRKNVGNNALRVTVGNLVAHGLRPTAFTRAHEGREQKLQDRALCSSLIANAYAHVPFHSQRAIADHRPVDLLKSRAVARVGAVS